MNILLVDDSKTMRNILKKTLTQLGYENFAEAEDGLQALEQAKANTPDLILLDWNMPNMNGLEFLKEYRPLDKDTPIIMVTTEAEKSRVIEAIKAGVNNYVIKPFTPEMLKERIGESVAAA